MSFSTEQLFVKDRSQDQVIIVLKKYVTKFGKKWVPHPKYKLDGIKQILSFLVKRNRKFLVYTKSDWTTVWELVEYSSFADPHLTAYLSKELATTAIWIDIADDYNIWRNQVFNNGKLVSEEFLPRAYHLGKDIETINVMGYGSCFDRAEKLNKKYKIPQFLVPLSQVERTPNKFKGLKKVICKGK